MPRFRKSVKYSIYALGWIVGGSAAVFAFLVASKIFITVPSVSAAGTTLYPHFCLGGWDGPQNAAGLAALSGDSSASDYTKSNSAFLGSSVAAQIFCGYFSAPDRSHPPQKVSIAFRWLVGDGSEASSKVTQQASSPVDTASSSSSATTTIQQSFSSSPGSPVISPSTGFTVIQESSSSPSISTSTSPSSASSSTQTDQTTSTTSTTTSVTDPSTTTIINSPSTDSTSVSTPTSSSPTPASVDAPAPSPITAPASAPVTPTPSDGSPTSFIDRVLGFIAMPVYGQITGTTSIDQATDTQSLDSAIFDSSQSNAPFLQISYSVDGVRWTSVGTVGLDNWKDYKISIPVTSWADLNNLQIMLNPIPSLDTKPDIYLESIAVSVDYNRTITEAISDVVAAAADALTGLTDKTPQQTEPAPHQPEISLVTHKKKLFSLDGGSINRKGQDIKPIVSGDGTSLSVSGKCSNKYFVVMLFRNPSDYKDKPTSAVINGAWECHNGSFSYDLSSLPSDLSSGRYYLLTGEEGEAGSWTATSDIVPIDVTASTSVETVTH